MSVNLTGDEADLLWQAAYSRRAELASGSTSPETREAIAELTEAMRKIIKLTGPLPSPCEDCVAYIDAPELCRQCEHWHGGGPACDDAPGARI